MSTLVIMSELVTHIYCIKHILCISLLAIRKLLSLKSYAIVFRKSCKGQANENIVYLCLVFQYYKPQNLEVDGSRGEKDLFVESW